VTGRPAPRRVFVSYAHEPSIDGHRERALELTQSLRIRGVEANIDQFVEHDPPIWPRWTLDQIKDADYVLCLASPSYKERAEAKGDPTVGRGARWEGAVITEELYYDLGSGNHKFVAVLVEKCSVDDIPDVLLPIGRSYYVWPVDDELLYRRITGQPVVIPAPLGEVVFLPPRIT
jgi:hypothetical protein